MDVNINSLITANNVLGEEVTGEIEKILCNVVIIRTFYTREVVKKEELKKKVIF
ncbi:MULTISPECIES: hypothetical protein [Enterococcus]|uniref:Uncharacterized protein n=1 Tax=Enterococcus faecium TaxID=1352 RepID=A0A366TEK2_ENTFC|nr:MULTISPECIES: hypothetical protein [Enterococcus]EGP0011020.1 hypothetical protein [Enterococcus faecium]EGP4879750.1 hypothetical protein [Enterococcus faecium]EGP4907833.1 hypothetical protein [Enterococcus faecium]EGP5080884.1 hypothetical protein [Enterococcus faecium]EIZ8427192.1 hypothetical protein [Enterococcus faecium]